MFKFLKSLFANENLSEYAEEFKKLDQIEKETTRKIHQDNVLKYGSNFNCVYEYNQVMANWLSIKNVPRFQIDWLAQSIQKGVEVDFIAVSFSVENELPYLCDTEDEVWIFESEENPLQNSTEGIYRAILKYSYGSTINENKKNYWINQLLSLARNNNIMAKALLCWKCGYLSPDGKYDGVIPQNMWEESKAAYEDSIMQAYKSGDAYAQLAVAKYNGNISEDEEEKLYLSAIEKGLSDACYYYAKFLDQKRFVKNGMTVNIPNYGTKEWQEYMRDELSLYKKGAELNNGILAGYCQYRLGDMYANGDGGVLKDDATAQIWYKKAYDNGCKKAEGYIEK